MAEENNYEELANHVVEFMGGSDNIIYSLHCTTRLIFNLKDKSRVKDDEIVALKDVIGTEWQRDQYQIIIGHHVSEAYEQICKVNKIASILEEDFDLDDDHNDIEKPLGIRGKWQEFRFRRKENQEGGTIFKYLQRTGKALMLPIAGLPIAGMLLGIGGAFLGIAAMENAPPIFQSIADGINQSTFIYALLTIMNNTGEVVFGNLPLLFAVGVASGLAKKDKSTAALASVFGYLVMNQVISTMLELGVTYLGALTPEYVGEYATYVTTNLGIFTLNMSVFGGIITGLVTAALHNRFYNIEFHPTLAFFSGARFVPIVTSLAMAFVGVLLAFTWPVVQGGIAELAVIVNNSGPAGTFLYGLIERMLVPFGLHHVFYTPFWFGSFVEANLIIHGTDTVVYGASTAYFTQLGSMGDLIGATSEQMANIVTNTTRFMAGKFPFMMFGLPGAALAMYKCAKPEKRKAVGGLLLAASLTSFLTGITEPIEFTFLFVAPVLFGIHAIFAGISFMLMDILTVFIGQTFSGGFIDFALFGLLPAGAGVSTRWYMVILVGIVYFIVYYFLFSTLIKKFDLKTPGREKEDAESRLYSREDFEESKGLGINYPIIQDGEDEWKIKAPYVLAALGGSENIENIDSCITRLRVEVKNTGKVNKRVLKALGATGVMKVKGGVQAIYGGNSNALKNHILDIIED